MRIPNTLKKRCTNDICSPRRRDSCPEPAREARIDVVVVPILAPRNKG